MSQIHKIQFSWKVSERIISQVKPFPHSAYGKALSKFEKQPQKKTLQS